MQNQLNNQKEFGIGPLFLAFGLFSRKKVTNLDSDVPEEVVIDKHHDHFDLIKDETYHEINSGLAMIHSTLGAKTLSFHFKVLSPFVEISRIEPDGKHAQIIMANGLTQRRMFGGREFFIYVVRPADRIAHYSFRLRIRYIDDTGHSTLQDLYFRKKDGHFEHYLSHPQIKD